ncbi:MAG: response regulator [Burkholderiaceae bacterium]|jgi:signal transduction histidine kinase/HPt (histidine-containing phosphotransfer) domain-containing protein/FixJ family two-component response regulator|nr:response regulator [Burkholderiaceae bacterium]
MTETSPTARASDDRTFDQWRDLALTLQDENTRLSRQMRRMQITLDRNKVLAQTSANMDAFEQRERLRQEKFMNMLLANSPEATVLFDQDERIAYCTHPFLVMAQIPHFELASGRLLPEVLTAPHHEEILENILSAFRKTRQTLRPIARHFAVTSEEDTRNYNVYVSPMLSEEKQIEGLILIFHDLTDIVRAKEAAEEANLAKSSFLASTSHEIRTPMNAIMGMCELILRENLPESAYNYASGIKQASANLLSIINDILDFSKIESGKLEILPDHYFLASIVNDLVNVIRTRVVDKPIQLLIFVDPNLPSQLVGDEVRVRQTILNILGNAVKYTNEGFVSLSIEYGEQTSGNTVELVFTVQDSGVGIKEEDQERLFGDFIRLNQTGLKTIEGTGLGLSIAKSLSMAMGGDISVSSEYGKGSTFTVKLLQELSGDSKLAEVHSPEKILVLLYETREKYGNSFMRSLEKMGVEGRWVRIQSEFYEALMDKDTFHYSHVFVSQSLLIGAMRSMEAVDYEAKLIAFMDYGIQSASSQMQTIHLPVHAISLANILNDDNNRAYGATERGQHFVAPDARILIVDDIATNLVVGRGLMAPYKMQIDSCISGREAIELVQQHRYDIVFMDHMMPEMDGIETTEKIRELAKTNIYYATLPIIALTANAVFGMKELFLDSGMDDYLPKPIEISKLDAMLEKWIPEEKQQKQQENQSDQGTGHITLQNMPGIDIPTGISLTGGTVANYVDVLRSYSQDAHEKIHQIRKTYADGDISLYAIYVHALKGASASIGAASLSVMAKELETAAKSNDIPFVTSKTEPFLSALEPALRDIDRAVAEYDRERQAGAPALDNQALILQCQQLKKALAEIDIATADDIVSSMLQAVPDVSAKKSLQDISNAILLADYDEAVVLTDQLQSGLSAGI